MYLHSKNLENVKEPVCLTRAMKKTAYKTASKCATKYLNSPFYEGPLLRYQLSSEMQKSDYNVVKFTGCLKTLYTRYQEMW